MYRLCLIIACCVAPCAIFSAQQTPDPDASQTQKPVASLTFEQAVEQAKLVTENPIIHLDFQFEGTEQGRSQFGSLITPDGVAVTIITADKPISKIQIHSVREDVLECRVLGRDATTGIALVQTPLHCTHPLNLAATWLDVEKAQVLEIWGPRGSTSMLPRVSRASDVEIGDLKLRSVLTAHFAGAGGMGGRGGMPPGMNASGRGFGAGAVPRINGMAYLKGNLIQGISYENSPIGDRVIVFPADEARAICDKLLAAVQRPPLPKPVKKDPIVEPLPPLAEGTGDVVSLQVEFKNGDCRIMPAAVLDDSGCVVTDNLSLAGVQKARCRQVDLVLDAPLQDIVNESLAVFKLLARVKYRPIEIGIEPLKLEVGDPVFQHQAGSGEQANVPSGKLVQLDATLATFDITVPHLLACDQSLPPGTPLFNQAGRFVGLCLQTPQIFAKTTLIMPADQVWKLAGKALSRMDRKNHDFALQMQFSGRQVVQTYLFGPTVPAAAVSSSEQLAPISKNSLPPELVGRIHRRLKQAFPELQIALAKTEPSLIVVVEPQGDVGLLASVDYWIERLRSEVETTVPRDITPTQSLINDPGVRQTTSPVVRLQLIPDVEKMKSIEVINASFVNKAGDMITWLPEEWLPGKEGGVQRLEVEWQQGDTIPAQVVCRDAETGITLVSARLRCPYPFAWDEKELFTEAEKFGATFATSGFGPGFTIGRAADVKLREITYQQVGILSTVGLQITTGGLLTRVTNGKTSAAGLILEDTVRTENRVVLPGEQVVKVCRRLLAEAKRPPLYQPPSEEELVALRNRPLPTGAAWSDTMKDNGDHLFDIAICFDEDGHFVRPGLYDQSDWPVFYYQGQALKAFQVGNDPQGDVTVWGVSSPIPEGHLDISPFPTKFAVNQTLRLNPVSDGQSSASPTIKIMAVERVGRGAGWKSRTILRLDRELIPGTPLFRDRDLVAVVVGVDEDPRGGCIAYPASAIVEAIDRVRQDREPKAAKGSAGTTAFDPTTALATTSETQLDPRVTELDFQSLRHGRVVVPRLAWQAAQKQYPKLIPLIEFISEDPDNVVVNVPTLHSMLKDTPEARSFARLLKLDRLGSAQSVDEAGMPSAAPQPGMSKVKDLISRYRGANGVQREALREELTRLTSQQFDQRHQQRFSELKTLEERLTSLRTELKKRQELRDEIIRKRVADLLEEDNPLKWESEADDRQLPPAVGTNRVR